jgi:hypothetical protein
VVVQDQSRYWDRVRGARNASRSKKAGIVLRNNARVPCNPKYQAKIIENLAKARVLSVLEQKKEAMPSPSFLGIAPSKPGRLSA